MPEYLTKKFIKRNLRPGYYVISYSMLHGLDCPIRSGSEIKYAPRGYYSFFQRFKNRYIVGTTLHIFEITNDDLTSI